MLAYIRKIMNVSQQNQSGDEMKMIHQPAD